MDYDTFWKPIDLPGENCCDNRVLYDPYFDRWIIVGKTFEASAPNATFLAVSQSGDPLGKWDLYRIPGDPTGLLGPDYPRVGHNKDWIVVVSSMVRQSDDIYVGLDLYALSARSRQLARF